MQGCGWGSDLDVFLNSSDPTAELGLCNIVGGPSGIQFLLRARSRGFSGEFQQSLEPAELLRFLKNLRGMHKALRGSADLRTHDDADGATFTIDPLGRVKVEVTMVHYGTPPHRLEIAFFSDQSCLPAFAEQLEKAGKDLGCL